MFDERSNPDQINNRLTAAEFFAGIGLVRIGLEQAGFRVSWSNDIDPLKREMYTGNFVDTSDSHQYVLGDIGKVEAVDLPEGLALAWASFPCTDLSLAGRRDGLAGEHSSTFWHFARILDNLEEARPQVIALENVAGLATSRGGRDMAAAIGELNRLGYSIDVLAVDARRFVPQSRPRLFLVGAQNPPPDRILSHSLRPDWLQWVFEDASLVTHRAELPLAPELLTGGLHDAIETMDVEDPRWWNEERLAAMVSSLSPLQHKRIDVLRHKKSITYRTAYRRTRTGIPVWEVRSDEIAGCLRTARGGSSKQAVVRLGAGAIQARWMTPLEYARLMGAGGYRLDGLRANQVLFGFGDAVCVPAVAWLATHYLVPLASGTLGSPEIVGDERLMANA